MFLEERYQAAQDHTAMLLEEAAAARLIRKCSPTLPWWRRAFVWRRVQFTVHLPSFITPQDGHSA
jgi:hypothetical protein